MLPKIDQEIGMDVYSTNFVGCGGRIKEKNEDFQVVELLSKSILEDINSKGKYTVYNLKKNGIDTTHALNLVRNKTGMNLKALGLKDAHAMTEQYVCTTRTQTGNKLVNTDKVSISQIGFVNKPFSKKDMIGNQFIIKINDIKSDIASLNDEIILNFYGYQRFGSKRPVSHKIGKAIIQGDFQLAVETLLGATSEYDTTENNKTRQRLAENSISYEEIPKGMDLERMIYRKMTECGDYLVALRNIPVSMRRFFVQAYQSFLFNKTLSRIYKDEISLEAKDGDVCFNSDGKIGKYNFKADDKLAIPFVGYSYYKKTRFHEIISEVLQEENIKPADFFTKQIQEAGNEGGFREALIMHQNFTVTNNIISFMLTRGSFATILLREIMKPENPLESGF